MNDEQFVAALKKREPEALQQLVSTYSDRLLRSAFLLCRNETEAQDIVQDTFVEAIRSAHRFQHRSGVYTWLHAILLNLTRHHHRKQSRLVYDSELANAEIAAPAASQSPMDAEAAARSLQAALQQLSPAHREVVVLRYYEEMKIEDIGRHLGLSSGTVKSRLHYATRELKKQMPGELNLFRAEGTEEMTMQ